MSPRPPRAAGGLVAVVALAAIAAAAACEGADSYVYTAQRFDRSAACLEPYRAVEVVEGPGVAATCPVSCLSVGPDVFVTTMCPPLPTIATELAPDDDACLAALEVLGTTCGEAPDEIDGGASSADGGPTTLDGSASSDLDAGGADAGDGA